MPSAPVCLVEAFTLSASLRITGEIAQWFTHTVIYFHLPWFITAWGSLCARRTDKRNRALSSAFVAPKNPKNIKHLSNKTSSKRTKTHQDLVCDLPNAQMSPHSERLRLRLAVRLHQNDGANKALAHTRTHAQQSGTVANLGPRARPHPSFSNRLSTHILGASVWCVIHECNLPLKRMLFFLLRFFCLRYIYIQNW